MKGEHKIAQAADGTWWVLSPNGYEGWCPSHFAFPNDRYNCVRMASRVNTNPHSHMGRFLGKPEALPAELMFS